VVQLTHNVRNLVGDGCLEPGNAGLSAYGHAVVERLNDLGSIVDLSHCGKRTIADLLAARGHNDRVIEKVIGGNWLRLCDEVWKA
jgi:microsomal dipeptidase-like Zn-dependent dipeptidase